MSPSPVHVRARGIRSITHPSNGSAADPRELGARRLLQSGRARFFLWAGVLLYLIAWFLPAHAIQTDPSWPRSYTSYGCQAFLFCWDLLTRDHSAHNDGWIVELVGSTCLTNLVMLLAVALQLARIRANKLSGALLLVCAGWNCIWIYFDSGDYGRGPYGSSLRAGFYLWLASFAWVGLALLLQRRPKPAGA